METEGPQTNEGKRKPPSDSNVVRLQDWIGPYEELVPLRPRARPPERAPVGSRVSDTSVAGGSEAADASGFPSAATLMPQAPPAAADFWGERSAAVHDALSAPDELWLPNGDLHLSGVAASRRIPQLPRVFRRLAPAGTRAVRALATTHRRALIAGAATAVVLLVVALAIAGTSRSPTGAVHSSTSAAATYDDPPLHPNAAAASAILGLSRAASRKPTRRGGARHHSPPAAHPHKAGRSITLARSSEPSPPSNAATPAAASTPEHTRAPTSSASSTADSSNHGQPAAPVEPHSTQPTRSVSSSSSGSGTPSTATLRSLITGAGTCSCQ